VDAAEVQRVRQALDDCERRHRGLLGDFDRVRRRTAQEQEAARRDGRRAALLPLLEVLDTLERALAAGSTDRSFYEGVAATHRLFLVGLREAGAEPIETVGRRFDPTMHEAIATAAANGVEPDTVVREARRGWRIGDDLLRAAQVVVAAPAERTHPRAGGERPRPLSGERPRPWGGELSGRPWPSSDEDDRWP
jgi:molecular chaperone GrpE